MKTMKRDHLVHSVSVQIGRLEELRERLDDGPADDRVMSQCLETMRRVEQEIRKIRENARDFEEYRQVAVCSMITRI